MSAMGKASRTKQAPDRRARVAAQREAARRADQRKRIYLAGGSILAVIIVVVAFVLVSMNSHNSSSASGGSNGPTGAALTSLVNQTTSVPASVLDQVGDGGGAVTVKPTSITGGTPLTSGGKPEVLYIGAEYCPYCAGTRWAMIVALSRFGTFSGLSTVHSSSTDTYPNTPTWTFYKSSYTSPYLTFTPVETTTNVPNGSGGGYVTLQTPTAAQSAVWSKYDAGGSIPFIDFGNKYMISGASYNPQVLAGKTWAQISAALHNPSSQIAQAINGTANYITATICKLTGNQPATACTSVVQSLQSKI